MSEIVKSTKTPVPELDENGMIIVPDFARSQREPVTPTTPEQERYVDVTTLVRADIAADRKYVVPSTSSNKVYIMKPTGEIQGGQIVMVGPDSYGEGRWEKTVPIDAYVRMHEAEIAADRAVAERVGAGALDVVEVAVNAGVNVEPQAEVLSVQDHLNKLTEGLSEADIQHLQRFARHTADKSAAQKAKDGGGSTTYGQYAGQEYRAMSSSAQNISSRYAAMWAR